MAARLDEPHDAALLRLWERGAAAGPIERALLLAGEARPDLGVRECHALPIGVRDREIAGLRVRTFGPAAEFTSRCARCSTDVEVAIDDVARLFDEAANSADARPVPQGRTLRPVTSEDLIAAAAAAARGQDPRAAIIDRVVSAADGAPMKQLDAETLNVALESLDAAAEIGVELTCPDCGNAWTALLDIADYTWRELAGEAGRIADEVAALASAYGWHEADTLAMSRARRALYLERMPR